MVSHSFKCFLKTWENNYHFLFLQGTVELANELKDNKPASNPEISKICETDNHSADNPENSNTLERSSLKVELVTANDSGQQSENQNRSVQGTSSKAIEVKTDISEKKLGDEAVPQYSPTQEISASEWLQKVRKEEEREMVSSAKRESVSSARKGRRKPPAPAIPLATANGMPPEMKNGQVVSHTHQHSSDSILGGRIVHQRSTTTEMYISQHTRTLVPGEPSFSRHPMTLIDLKKQRVEERKSTPPMARSLISNNTNAGFTPISSIAAGDSSETVKPRYRSPSDAVVGRSSPRSRSPKMGLRCCRIT